MCPPICQLVLPFIALERTKFYCVEALNRTFIYFRLRIWFTALKRPGEMRDTIINLSEVTALPFFHKIIRSLIAQPSGICSVKFLPAWREGQTMADK